MSALPFRHIAIEGPIGVGKTSLTNLLAKRFRGTKVLEDADNPFLDDFYKDKRGAALRRGADHSRRDGVRALSHPAHRGQ